ncbi:MAG TPA: DNA-directed RNA polymerase subunit RpoH/Rpb5 C-terminal domain-containing protein [Candidatus Nanoarchaeia archaeon]|nr:DNA-directed RNA polymerase subunit RpoH/Rpb5 C-terminal domain-containing protein [Candidatus Nanoarchaeia archaeon]
MHILQPKHTKMSDKEANELLVKFNISKAQLPKMFLTDAALPPNCQIGDVVKIEREDSKDNKTYIYYRVII